MTQKVPVPSKVERFLSATYCDDVRQEVHNKLSFVGIYQHSLLVPSFPAKILRLCVVLQVFCPKDNRFKSAKLAVYRDEQLFGEFDLVPSEDAWEQGPKLGYLGAMVPFIFENVEFSARTKFQVRVTFDDGVVIPAPSLVVDALPQAGLAAS